MRTKACIHTMTGHTNTVADVKCQGVEPQVKIYMKDLHSFFYLKDDIRLFVGLLS